MYAEGVCFVGQLVSVIALGANPAEEEVNNTFIYFLIVMVIRYIPAVVVLVTVRSDWDNCDPKDQKSAIYFLMSVACDATVTLATDGLVWKVYKFRDEAVCEKNTNTHLHHTREHAHAHAHEHQHAPSTNEQALLRTVTHFFFYTSHRSRTTHTHTHTLLTLLTTQHYTHQ